MAEEVPGEVAEVEEKAKDPEEEFVGEGELKGETRTRSHTVTEPSLASDFCKPGEDYGEEELVEEEWICEEVGERGELYGEGPGYEEGYLGEEEEEILTVEEKRSLDSEYLKAVLGTPLTFAMLELANKRPTDPIQFLAHFLLKWRWSGDSTAKQEELMKELNAERALFLEKIKERERREMLEKEEEEEAMRRAKRVESSLEDDEDLGEGQELAIEEEE